MGTGLRKAGSISRYGALLGIGLLTFVVIPEMARWRNGGAFAQSPLTPTIPQIPTINNSPGNCNNYGINSGTITNNCPTINQAPLPEIQLLTPQFSHEKRPDGKFSHQILLKITALSNLDVLVCGDALKDLSAGPYPAGMASVTPFDAPPNCIKKRFDNVQGTWAIDVVTDAEDNKFTVTPVLLP